MCHSDVGVRPARPQRPGPQPHNALVHDRLEDLLRYAHTPRSELAWRRRAERIAAMVQEAAPELRRVLARLLTAGGS
jgi:hypothetical protein